MAQAACEPVPRLRISEIFLSLQGEARSAGWPTVFIRLTGCPLRCSYCDTTYAFSGGSWSQCDEILEQVAQFGVRHVCVTGGEPLAQPDCTELLRQLCDAGYEVSLETSGALDIGTVDERVCRVMDLKTPASGEEKKNCLENIRLLQPRDQLKMVICDQEDYAWARQMLESHQLAARCEVIFSPCYGQMEPALLAEWILRDRLPVRFQIQLHKILWGEEPGR